MRKRPRQSDRRHGNRYSAAFKSEAIEKFEDALKKGELSSEIVKRLKVSIASVNRWRREEKRLQNETIIPQHRIVDIDKVISRLGEGTSNDYLRLEAFSIF